MRKENIMKTNITLDPGVSALMETINEKLLSQAKTCKWLATGLLICGVYTAWSVKHINMLEAKIKNTDGEDYTES